MPISPVNDVELTEEIEVPLTARKVHQLSIGFPADFRDRFRVAIDDGELYTAGWEGFRMGSSFSGHTGGHFGLIQPATLESQARDYSKQLSAGDWRLLCSKSFTLSRGKERRQIRFTVGLRTSGQIYASEEIYWSAQRSLNLEWDSELNRYRILGSL